MMKGSDLAATVSKDTSPLAGDTGSAGAKQQRLIKQKEAAARTGMSEKWLECKRWAGNGPPYIKLPNGSVLYDEEQLFSWFDSFSVRNTSEASERDARR